VYGYLGHINSVNKFMSYGSTGAARVGEQMAVWREALTPEMANSN